jgi:hypothetical protein
MRIQGRTGPVEVGEPGRACYEVSPYMTVLLPARRGRSVENAINAQAENLPLSTRRKPFERGKWAVLRQSNLGWRCAK